MKKNGWKSPKNPYWPEGLWDAQGHWASLRSYGDLEHIAVPGPSKPSNCWWIVPTPLPLKTVLTGRLPSSLSWKYRNYTCTQIIMSFHKKRSYRVSSLCINSNFVAEVKDLQQQGTLEKVTEPTEWVSAPTVVNCKLSAKNGIRLCIGSRSLNIAPKRHEYPNSAVDHLLTEFGYAN